jgi:two-component system phosphate regulon response regulator PhoB
MPTVLVVDDDPDIRDIATIKLEQAGLRVLTEADGEAGLAAALEAEPDVVLLDWMMPRLTGIEVCVRLREHAKTAQTPIVMLTAKAQEADIERGFAAGANDYIVKPFSARERIARVGAQLQRSQPGGTPV